MLSDMTMTPPPQPTSLKIMVIDDSSTIRRSAEIFLTQAGYQVVLAEDGFDALAKINDHHPALVFCDILMPRLDGYQTCALIKKSARFHATPVLMLSSKDGLFDRARGAMVGSAAYLTKPFSKDSLLAAVREHTAPMRADNDLAANDHAAGGSDEVPTSTPGAPRGHT
jgi:twitching motility two-component system response regulator PilG